MHRLRPLIARLALLLLLVVPTELLGRVNLLPFPDDLDGGASSSQQVDDAELANEAVGPAHLASHDTPRRPRAPRVLASLSGERQRISLVADLRPTRPHRPVRYPPFRPPLIRLLN